MGMPTENARIYTTEEIESMPGSELARILKSLTKRDLVYVLLHAAGGSPASVCAALNAHERYMAEYDRFKAELQDIAIHDSERTCDQQNPDGSGEYCVRGSFHIVHRDSNGEEWTA